jgi:zinc and cadmium transporter
MCPLGAALFLFGVHQLAAEPALAVGCALAFAAGVFLCIALSDLLPEMELHSHHRVRLTAALVLGITVAWGIRWLEPEHAHPDAAQGAGQGTTGVR